MRRTFIPEEQLDLILNAAMDTEERLQELNEWERWHRSRALAHSRNSVHPWFACGSCGTPTQGAKGFPGHCSEECAPSIAREEAVEHRCGRCGRSFEALASKSSGYCSEECRRLEAGITVERHCAVCGTRIIVKRSMVDDDTPYHCSNRCRRIARGTLSTTECAHCGREFDISTRVLADGNPHHCSQSCSSAGTLPDSATLSARGAYAVSSSGAFISRIEAPVAEVLEALGIDYEAQHLLTHPDGLYSCVVDFWLTELNAVVEVNGGYWHADPHLYHDEELNETQLRGRERYARKVELLELLGIELIEVWERDIHRADEVLLQGFLELRERRSASS
jgi:very-short-patch-repair endonuclease